MIKGLISHKVRQSPPKTPAKKCSPEKNPSQPSKRGPKNREMQQVPLVCSEFVGQARSSYPSLSDQAWNALTSRLRERIASLLISLQEFFGGHGSDVELIDLVDELLPEWTYETGRTLTEAVLLDQTGHLGNRLCCQNCGQNALRFKDYRSLNPKGLLGEISISRARYFCDACGDSVYPLDHQLGLDGKHRMFPKLQEAVARMSSRVPYEEAKGILLSILPTSFSLRTQENVTHTVAASARADQQREFDRAFGKALTSEFPACTKPPERGSVAAIAVDGGFCRMRDGEEPAREFKMGVLGAFDPKPRQTPKERAPRVHGKHYVGSFKGAEFVMNLGLLEFHRMGLNKAKIVQVLGDGAEWIWRRAHYFLAPGQELVRTLDVYHAREYIANVANTFYGQGTPKAREWYEKRDQELLDGNLRSFFLAFTLLAKRATEPDTRELVLKSRQYFENHREFLNYRECLTRGLLIGSGMVEGGIRFVAKDRLHRTGMSWLEPGAEDILHLRALCASKRWKDFSFNQKQKRRAKLKQLTSTWKSVA